MSKCWQQERGGTYDGDEEADVSLSEAVADEVILPCEYLLETIEGVEDRHDGSFVRLLRCRKAGFIHAVWSLLSAYDHKKDEMRHVLLTVSYTHSLSSSISLRRDSG